MALVGTKRASELTGKSKSTIQRAMDKGVLSFELDRNDRRVIDVSELERVFGFVTPPSQKSTHMAAPSGGAAGMAGGGDASPMANMSHQDILEMERMKIRVKMLEDKIDLMETQIDDMRSQRDQWQKQAQQVLLTSQYSQRQAEEYKAEIRERDRRVEAKRQQILKERMGQSGSYNGAKNYTGAASSAEGVAGKKSGPSNGPSNIASDHLDDLPADKIPEGKIPTDKTRGKANGGGSASSSGSASQGAGSSSSSSSSSTGRAISQKTNSANQSRQQPAKKMSGKAGASASQGATGSIWGRLKKHVTSSNAA